MARVLPSRCAALVSSGRALSGDRRANGARSTQSRPIARPETALLRRATRGDGPRLIGRSAAMDASTGLAGYIQRCREVNNVIDAKSEILASLISFRVDGHEVGHMRKDFADAVSQRAPDVFVKEGAEVVTLHNGLGTAQERTEAVNRVMQDLRGTFITGWRSEMFPVSLGFGQEPLFLVERAAAAWFGIKAYGVHVNGFVRDSEGGMHVWVARRSKTKPTWPGMLDHIVAGGQPYGISPRENVIKECQEEAGIPQDLAATARPAGCVTYEMSVDEGLKRDALFVYDLELPASFQPIPTDGEVEAFELWPVEKVAEVVRTTKEYKPNCCLVIIDFLVRHGYITPEAGPGYVELISLLHA
ncbi:unnamed protein product [Pedinophyceae sp. YPF-701]|nr:unnamed protein product [Pedinophyceae sp. YPF-701]